MRMNKKEAERIGKQHCPEGWKYEVWQNCGWHACWKRGPISAYKAHDGFHAMIAQNPDECGYGGEWSKMYSDEFPLSSPSVLEAAAVEVKRFERYALDQMTKLGAIRRAIWSV